MTLNGFMGAMTPRMIPAPAGDSKATVFSLDAATGQLLWSSGIHFPSYASCLPISVQGRPQIENRT